MSSALDFYNSFIPKLTYDFLRPNKRIASAINFVLSKIDRNGKSILDIGCGLGWSSYEFSRNTDAVVNAVDLSPNLIDLAKGIFGEQEATYEVKNVNDGFDASQKFSSIVMIDVYEHIEKENREAFAKSLSGLLDEKFQLFITCPTVDHQNYLREHNPGGLQPVDEDVTKEHMEQLAEMLGGELSFFEVKSIFRSGDYFHAMISHGAIDPLPSYGLLEKQERVQKLIDFKKNVLQKKVTIWDRYWFMFPKHGHDLISGGFRSKKVKGF